MIHRRFIAILYLIPDQSSKDDSVHAPVESHWLFTNESGLYFWLSLIVVSVATW